MKRSLLAALSLALLLSLGVSQGARTEPTDWQQVRGPYGGSVAALALSPNYAVDHMVFAGLRGQGIYRTVDGGQTWHSSSPHGWVVTGLVISPAFDSDQTLFAAQGLPTSGYSVHRSTDEGGSWEDVSPSWSGLPDPPGLAISPDFAVDETVYVLGGAQTFVSTNGGDTFLEASGWFTAHHVVELAFSPAYASDQSLFALVPAEGLYKSTNGGATWMLTGLTGNYSTFAVSPDYANDEMLLAIGATDGQLHVSGDGGDTWSPGTLTLNAVGQHTLSFSPTYAADSVILAASSADPGPYRSEDGSATWLPVGVYDPAQPYHGGFVGGSVFALALAPGDIWDTSAFAGSSSGIYHSSDRGVHWFQSSKGLARLTVRALALAPGDPSRMLVGTSFFEHLRFDSGMPGEYDGNLQLSIDGGQTWRDVSGPLERVQDVAFSPGFAKDETAFAIAGTLGQHGYFDGGTYRSTNGGQDWEEIFADRICRALALSPGFFTDQTLWVSAFTYSTALGVYVSTNGGDTWESLAPAIHAQVLVPSPNYGIDRTLFAGTADSGLQRSADGGLSWTQVLSLPVTSLAVSPAYGASRTLYAGVREGPAAVGEIHRSADGGDTWQKLDTGIPAEQEGDTVTISKLAFAHDGSILAGVYYGNEQGNGAVYRSDDGGKTWHASGDGLRDYSVFALATGPIGSMAFYAGTDGGLWQLHVVQGSPAEPGTWASSGPHGGRAQALAVSPEFADDGLALAGEWVAGRYGDQSGLGIFKSTDGGETWQSSATGTEDVAYSSAVHDFAFSPDFVSDRTIFAATWGGLFKSTDSGETWSWAGRLYAGGFGSITAVAVAPNYADSGQVLAASGWTGLAISDDGGINWTHYLTVPATSALAYSPDFGLDGVAFAGGFGLYRTDDGGTGWTEVLTHGVSALAVSPAFGTDGIVFAGGDALYISDDGGTNWISTTLPATSTRINALAISPGFATDQTLFAGNNDGLYESNDGGDSWQPATGYPGLPVRSLAISPLWPAHPVLLVGTDQGVYRTSDGGTTWIRMQGMTPLSTEPLILSRQPDLLVTGAYRHGIYCSADQGQSWSPMGLQESTGQRITSIGVSPDYANDGTMFAVTLSTVTIGAGIHRTTDRGLNWEQVYGAGYLGGLALSPQYADDEILYTTAESSVVLRSEDGGENWSPVGDWPAGVYNPARLVALPPTYPADSTVFAAGDGFWRLNPGATTWEPAASGLLTDTSVSDFVVSPNYSMDRTLLAAASWQEGWGGVYHHGVFRSTDGGANWHLANTGLPDAVVGGLAFSPKVAMDQTAYVTCGDRLYRSLDGGQNWTIVGPAPGVPVLHSPTVDELGGLFVASGRGVWQYTTPVQDMVVNGGFEADGGWELPQTPRPAAYWERLAYDGARSMRVGTDNGKNVYAYSSARQAITIPADAVSATLRCHVYLVSGESVMISQAQALSEDEVDSAPSPSSPQAGDAQYLLLLEPERKTLFWELSNAQGWQSREFDLSAYAGETVELHFGVFNDGAGGRTGMFVDNVSLVVARSTPPEIAHRHLLPVIQRAK